MNPRLPIALLLAVVYGCAPLPPAALPEVAAPASWPHQGGKADAPGLAERARTELWPIDELNTLIDEALRDSADLRIALERIELARAQYGIERAALLPGVDAAASAGRERMPGLHPSENQLGSSGALTLSMPAWEIDLWGRLAARNEAARREMLASAALAEGVRISLVAQVASLYLELLGLDEQLAITERTRASREQSLHLTRARFEAGIVSMLDVRQAEVQLGTSAQTLAELQRRRTQSENALSLLIGRQPGPIARSQSLAALTLPDAVGAGLPSALLTRRPDIHAAEQSLQAAGASVEAARRAFLPVLSLSTMLGFASPQLGQLFDSGRFAWSVQPALSLSLFDGGRRQAAVELAEAQQRILVEQYKATIRQAFREVSDALVAFERLSQQQRATEDTVHAQRERLRISQARYLAGIASHFEVLDAERQLFDGELALSRTQQARHQAVVQLYRALGGGWRG